MTSGSCIGEAIPAFFPSGSIESEPLGWDEDGPGPLLALLSLRGKKFVSFWFGFSTFLNFIVNVKSEAVILTRRAPVNECLP